MPVLTRTQHTLSLQDSAEGRTSTDSNDTMGDELWFVTAEYDGSRKELSFPSPPLGKTPSRKDSLHNLSINTYPKVDLPERYNSDEEEPSPSTDTSETASVCEEVHEEEEEEGEEEELKHKSVQKHLDEEEEDIIIYEDYSAEVAVAVPIMIMGPPKLVDISNLAPIQRRKRTINHCTLQRSAVKNAGALASRSPTPMAPSRSAPVVPSDENALPSEVSTPTTVEHLPKRQDSLPDLTRFVPDSWLPEDNSETIFEAVEEQDDLYFPALDVRPSPTYNDYDPYSLNPPSLSPRNSHSYKSSPKSPSFPSPLLKKQPGSIARARKNSNPPSAANNGGWKGLTRTLSMAKRQEASHPQAKKPKMIARGPTEREEMPTIPPFPFEEKMGSHVVANAYTRSTTALSLKS